MEDDTAPPKRLNLLYELSITFDSGEQYEDLDHELITTFEEGSNTYSLLLYPPGIERKERSFYEQDGDASSTPWPTLRSYRPLDPSKEEIRIFVMDYCEPDDDSVICGHMETISLSAPQIPEYIALSYTWGDDTRTEWITIDSEPVEVRKTLWSFLKNLRTRASRKKYCNRFWADFICINQSDTAERNSQVAMMGRTYSEAWIVYAWLGEKTKNTEALCDLFDTFTAATTAIEKDSIFSLLDHRITEVAPGAPELEIPPWVIGVRELSLQLYWSRLWTVQELVLGQCVLLLTGDRNLGLRDFSAAQRRCREMPWPRCRSKILQICDTALSIRLGNHPTLEELLFAFGDSQCREARDKIYGILALLSEEDRAEWSIDYDADSATLWCELLDYLNRRKHNISRTRYWELLGRLFRKLCASLECSSDQITTVYPVAVSQVRDGITFMRGSWNNTDLSVVSVQHEVFIANGKMTADPPAQIHREHHTTTVISDCAIKADDRMLAFEGNLLFWCVYRLIDSTWIHIGKARNTHIHPGNFRSLDREGEDMEKIWSFAGRWRISPWRCEDATWAWPIDEGPESSPGTLEGIEKVLSSSMELSLPMVAEIISNSAPKRDNDMESDHGVFHMNTFINGSDGTSLLNRCWIIRDSAKLKSNLSLSEHISPMAQVSTLWLVVDENEMPEFKGHVPGNHLTGTWTDALLRHKAQANKPWGHATDVDLPSARYVYSETLDAAREMIAEARRRVKEEEKEDVPATD